MSSKNEKAIPPATKLQSKGIKFHRKLKPNGLLDVTFSKGKMEIPQLQLHDRTFPALRNLAAFEQCFNVLDGFPICEYCIFLDFLVDTPEDIETLRNNGIIMNQLGSNDSNAAAQFNTMCKGLLVKIEDSGFGDIFSKVNKEYDKYFALNRWVAILINDILPTPWAWISILAALVLIVFTITQTAYSIQAVHK